MEAAQTEVFWGKLRADDLGVLVDRLRDCLIPIAGMQSLVDISRRVYEEELVTKADGDEETLNSSWIRIVTELQGPIQALAQVVAEGLDHAGMTLGILPGPRWPRARARVLSQATQVRNLATATS